MSFIQLIQNTMLPFYQHYYHNYSLKNNIKLKAFTDKHPYALNNNLQIVDDLYNEIQKIQGKKYKYDHPKTITKHHMFRHFCNQFIGVDASGVNAKSIKAICTSGLPNNLKGVANYLKIILCLGCPQNVLDYIVLLIQKYDGFMKDPIFKAIFLCNYIEPYSNYIDVKAFSTKLKLNIHDVCIYMNINEYINYFEYINYVPDCHDFFKVTNIVSGSFRREHILKIDKTMILASEYVNYKDNIEEMFQVYINKNKCKRLSCKFHSLIGKLNISQFSTESLIRFFESECCQSNYHHAIYIDHIYPNLPQYDYNIIDRILMAGVKSHRYLVINSIIENGYLVEEKHLIKFIHSKAFYYHVKDFENYKYTLMLLINNIKNLSVIDVIPKLYRGYRRGEHIFFDLLQKVFLPSQITYDVVALYCKHIYYIPNLENYGLKYEKELYDAIFLLPRIPLYYLERFTHVSKDVLVNRFLFSNVPNFYEEPDECTQFIKENSTSLKVNVKRGLHINHQMLVKFVTKLGTMEGYSLQSLYMKYPYAYKKIAAAYDFIPQVGTLDFKLLNMNYYVKKI
jgi:hypothetical protein